MLFNLKLVIAIDIQMTTHVQLLTIKQLFKCSGRPEAELLPLWSTKRLPIKIMEPVKFKNHTLIYDFICMLHTR